MSIILGSSSPRRKEILQFFNIPFEQLSPSFDETSHPYSGDAIAYVTSLAEEKARSIPIDNRIILTADTVVLKGKTLYNKPESEAQALEMLHDLNGSTHLVYTALSCKLGAHLFTDYAETKITFIKATDNQLLAYHKAFNGLDKAGGYGIQKGGSIIVEKIEGCFYNVMGLPLSTLQKVLQSAGVELWDYLTS